MLAANVAVGAFLMLTRLVFGPEGGMANSGHVVGALVITTAVIATAEVVRALRFTGAGFGLWLVGAPSLLDAASTLAAWMGVGLGVGLVALSLPRGRRSQERYVV
jgi:hypothetical protein